MSAPARPTLAALVIGELKEGRRVVARGEVLAADVPVHPEVARHLQPALERFGVVRSRAEARSMSSAVGGSLPRGSRARSRRAAPFPRLRRGSRARRPRSVGVARDRPRPPRRRPRVVRARSRRLSGASAGGRLPARARRRQAPRALRAFPRRQSASASVSVQPPAKTARRRKTLLLASASSSE